MPDAVPRLPSVDATLDDRIRLLPARFHEAAPLVDPGAEGDNLDALVTLASGLGPDGRAPSPLVIGAELTRWQRRCVEAAFEHARPGGSRFNDERRGAWYSADTVDCAAAEVGWHHARELRAIGRLHDTLDYEVLVADFRGAFHDARILPIGTGVLHPEPEVAYPAGQALAADLINAGSRGLIYPSVRHDAGQCLVAFDPDAVGGVREGGRVRLVWNGSEDHALVRA